MGRPNVGEKMSRYKRCDCGKLFEAVRSTRKTCSNACRQAAYRNTFPTSYSIIVPQYVREETGVIGYSIVKCRNGWRFAGVYNRQEGLQ